MRVLNDADVQGFGAITAGDRAGADLGTGAGTAIFRDGQIMPHLEFAHHPVRGNKTYDQYIGRARWRKGKKGWDVRGSPTPSTSFGWWTNFDHLYIGGGNAAGSSFTSPPDVTIVSNSDGLTGGIALWRSGPPAHQAAAGSGGRVTADQAGDPGGAALAAVGETAADRPANPGGAGPGSDNAGSEAAGDSVPPP